MAKAPADIRSLCRAYTPNTVRIVAGIAQAEKGVDEETKLRAIGMLWERGWGRPASPVTGADGEGDIRITIRNIIEGKK
jgi:hypothetical protein